MAIFISAVDARALDDQKDALRAAKEVGVQRVIPCDFATPTETGVRELGDTVRCPPRSRVHLVLLTAASSRNSRFAISSGSSACPTRSST